MFKWLFNLFRQDKYVPSDEVETETYEVGKVELIFVFKDGSSDRASFTGKVIVKTKYFNHFNLHYVDVQDYYHVVSAMSEALDFLDARQKFGWYLKDENLLVPMSDIVEIIVARHPYSVTVNKL